MIRRMTMTIAFITFPMMFLLMLTAKPLFVLLYSDRWLQSVPYFQILCLIGLSECLQAVNTQPIAAIGKSSLMFKWTLFKRTIGLVFVIGGLVLFGMWGLLIGVVVFNWFCYGVNVGLVSRYIGYSWIQQLMDIFPMALVSGVSAVVSYFAVTSLHLSLYPDGVLKAFILSLLYLAWALLFKPEAYTYALGIIPVRFRFWDRPNKDKDENSINP